MTRSPDEQPKTAGETGAGSSTAAAASPESTPVPVTGPPKLRSEGGEPLCGNSRCRKLLPVGGRGRKHDYCPPDVTIWRDRKGERTCNDLGIAERMLFDIRGSVPTEVPAEFLDHLDAVLGPVELLQQTSGALLAGLGGVREQLATVVTTAEQERDRALAAEADANGRAEASDRKAAEAIEERDHANERADKADEAADDSRRAKERAVADKERAEGRVTELVRAQEREAERMAALLTRVERAEIDLATCATERDSAREERAAEKQRADDAELANIELERALRDEFRQELERRAEQQQRDLAAARDDYDQRLDAIRDRFDERLNLMRAEIDVEREQERGAHAAELGTLRQTLGALTHRAETAESTRDSQRTQIRAQREVLVATLSRLGEGEDDAALRERIQGLLDDA